MSDITFEQMELIAAEHLGIATLKMRNMDGLDFHDIHVASLKAALRAAYDLGRGDAADSKE